MMMTDYLGVRMPYESTWTYFCDVIMNAQWNAVLVANPRFGAHRHLPEELGSISGCIETEVGLILETRLPSHYI